MSTRRKISRNLSFSYKPSCHHCVLKLSGLFKQFSIDHQVISGKIDGMCACRLEGKSDRRVIKLVRNIFKRHRKREVGFLMDAECKVLNDEEDVC